MVSTTKTIKQELVKKNEEHIKFLDSFKFHRHQIQEREKDESVLYENKRRFVLMPIKFHEIYDTYKRREALFWTAEETDLTKDMIDWSKKLGDDEKSFVKKILAIFASGILTEQHLTEHLSAEVQCPEAKCFYGFQIMVDNIHEEVYSLVIDSLVKDKDELESMFDGIEEDPYVQKKRDFAKRWFNIEIALYGEKLVAFAAIQGIFSLISYASIFSLKKRGLMPCLTKVNKIMCRDHAMHGDFQCLMFAHLKNKINPQIVEKIIMEAAEIEKDSLEGNFLQIEQLGLDVREMRQMIEFVADNILAGFGNKKHYKVSNPYEHIQKTCLPGNATFFEKKVSEYQKAGAAVKVDNVISFSMNDDF